jgi:hypothetical protein
MAPSRGPLIAFEHSNGLASHSSEGADLSLQGAPLGGELPMLQSVSVALGSPATGPVHPADRAPPAIGTTPRSASIWRGISMPGA